MNVTYFCVILCISIFFNTLPAKAMEDKTTGLFESYNRRLMDWIILEGAPKQTYPFPRKINKDYKNHPDFSYFKSRFKNDFKSNESLDEIQFHIGSCYYRGIGVDLNFSSAAWWYHKSAMQNNVLALGMLNILAKNDKNEAAIFYLGSL